MASLFIGESWEHGLNHYCNALRIVLQSMGEWRENKGSEQRPLFTFSGNAKGWYRFHWKEEDVIERIKAVDGEMAQKRLLDPLSTADRVKTIVNNLKRPTSLAPSEVHGDFNPGNVFLAFRQSLPNGQRPTGQFNHILSPTFNSAILIDFANVTDGETAWVDYGKFMRELRELVLPQSLGETDVEKRLAYFVGVNLGRTDGNADSPARRATKLIKRTEAVFRQGYGFPRSKWPTVAKAASLFYELCLLCRCMGETRWPEVGYGGWPDKETASVAILSAIDGAVKTFDRP